MNRDELMKLDKSEIIEILFAIIDQQSDKISQQSDKIKQQCDKIAELEARVNQNSTNSSLPPSSDLFPKPQNPRKPSGKKVGGQKGHKGKGFKLPHPPDVVVEYNPVECTGCAHVDDCPASNTTTTTKFAISFYCRKNKSSHYAANDSDCSLVQTPVLWESVFVKQ
jgi:transposase